VRPRVSDEPVRMSPAAPIRPIYLVDWTTNWSSIDEVRSAQRALEEAVRRVLRRGLEIRCLQSLYLEDERRWLCLLASDSPATVALIADLAQIPQRYIRSGLNLYTDPPEGVEVLEGSAV
jgi:hypothetical protein